METLQRSITAWALASEERLRSLDTDEAEKLKRWFGHAVDYFVEEAEASERALLADLLEDIEI